MTFNLISQTTGQLRTTIKANNLEEATIKAQQQVDLEDDYMLVLSTVIIHPANEYINEIINR